MSQTLELTVPWDTAQHPPGTYRLQVRVTQPGTLSREVPGGVVLAQAETSASVIATSAIAGGLVLDPPLAQAGSSLPVQLSAVLVNDGNVPLTGQAFTLSIRDPDTGAILYGAQAEVPMIEVGDNATVQFGAWVPSRAGDLPVQVTSDHAAVTGRVSGVLYVGDKASGIFAVNRSVVPLGTQTVRASVALRGVDIRTASSTNPLFTRVRDAVRTGGVFVAREAPQWNERNRCLGCHIQTQSLNGLAASVGKAEIDQDALQYLYNDIVGSQQANGAFNASHQSIPVVSNALALWSLSVWPDARQAFRAMCRSASFQLSRLSNSGDQSWWASDHAFAWWSTSEGPTMAATKGMAATLRMAQEVGGTNVPDYSLEPSYELGVPNLMDFEQGPDGKLRYTNMQAPCTA